MQTTSTYEIVQTSSRYEIEQTLITYLKKEEIGITNIMLVTVVERTREIGIRKAIGARRRAILGQFLIEATILSLVGGILGVLVGFIGSNFMIVGVKPVIVPSSVFLAFGVSVFIGLFFGGYPASRAASLRPIEALRYE